MGSQQQAESSKTRSHPTEGEDPDYCSTTYALLNSDSQTVPKHDLREQPNHSPSSHNNHDSSMANHAIAQEPLSCQYNDLHSIPPPSPSPPPNSRPCRHPDMSDDSMQDLTPQSSTPDTIYEDEGGPVLLEPDVEVGNEMGQANETTTTMLFPIPEEMNFSTSNIEALQTAEQRPPVRPDTLSELDLNKIMGNINVRVDVNFNQDLYFGPIAGEKGRKKRKSAETYWEAMALEISIYSYWTLSQGALDPPPTPRHHNNDTTTKMFEPRLPIMLETLKDVINTLIPERDQIAVTQYMEVEFLMQQIHKGVLDLVKLIKWIAVLLKTHCAPMRDPWADQMVNEISEGHQTGDPYKVVQGLKTLFGTLEAMKLDVANHQIRAFRVLLIEDSPRFLREHFKREFKSNTMEFGRAKRWYSDMHNQAPGSYPYLQKQLNGSYEPIATLFIGLFSFVMPFDFPNRLPDTFKHDMSHLCNLRADIQDLMGLELCGRVFELTLARYNRYPSTNVHKAKSTLQGRIRSIVSGCEKSPLVENTHNIGIGSTIVVRTPRNIGRWRNNMSRIALEIARTIANLETGGSSGRAATYTDYLEEDTLLYIERTLGAFLSSPVIQYRDFRRSIQQKLEEATFACVTRYLHMTPLEMCEDQKPSQLLLSPSKSSLLQHMQVITVDSLARRLAHLGVLHWKIWSSLLQATHIEHLNTIMLSPNGWLSSLKLRQLQRLALLTGILSSGTKPILINRLHQSLLSSDLRRHFQPSITAERGSNGCTAQPVSRPLSVLSIDMGIRNLAYAHLQIPAMQSKEQIPKPILNAWDRLAISSFPSNLDTCSSIRSQRKPAEIPCIHALSELGRPKRMAPSRKSLDTDETHEPPAIEKESFAPELYASYAYTLISSLISEYQPTHILIERQRFRSGGGSAVLEWTIRVGVFEGMLYAVIHTLQQQLAAGASSPVVRGIDPQRVVRYWMMMRESDSENELKTQKKSRVTSSEGKKAKIDLIGNMISLSNINHNREQQISVYQGTDIGLIIAENSQASNTVHSFLNKWNKEGKRKPSSRSTKQNIPNNGTDNAVLDIKKLDDLADCLLQGITWLEWQKMIENVSRNGPSAAAIRFLTDISPKKQ
ncbi:hypothetical protein FQN57_005828 [Myotisia sp. PD_48]|nr:hypothetical protein FQN57_005828 [Myotisia sp. PD_48]